MRTGLRNVVAIASLLATSAWPARAAPATPTPVKNIVLVHGAFVDGSGWRPVYDILAAHGYAVTIVQQPLTGFADDVAATRAALARLDGPAILVGHSYGGAIITEAGNDPHVVGLVYVAAHAPDAGETEASNASRIPAAGRDAIKRANGMSFIDPARFATEFAGDLPLAEAEFEARAQAYTASSAFTTPIKNPAWKTKPSWYVVAMSDRIISPELERTYAARARSETIAIPGASHSVYRSRPKEVAALIEKAAREAPNRTVPPAR
jgi:pimeloyl-ACP methyl ester carboxylesterase